jgi:hypothetical protein
MAFHRHSDRISLLANGVWQLMLAIHDCKVRKQECAQEPDRTDGRVDRA